MRFTRWALGCALGAACALAFAAPASALETKGSLRTVPVKGGKVRIQFAIYPFLNGLLGMGVANLEALGGATERGNYNPGGPAGPALPTQVELPIISGRMGAGRVPIFNLRLGGRLSIGPDDGTCPKVLSNGRLTMGETGGGLQFSTNTQPASLKFAWVGFYYQRIQRLSGGRLHVGNVTAITTNASAQWLNAFNSQCPSANASGVSFNPIAPAMTIGQIQVTTRRQR